MPPDALEQLGKQHSGGFFDCLTTLTPASQPIFYRSAAAHTVPDDVPH